MIRFMANARLATPILTLLPFLVFGADLSKYRNLQLGTDLPTVAKLVGTSPSQARVVHTKPALFQELTWHPQSLGSSKAESAKEVILSFYDGQLFRVTIEYDRYETEGLTAADFIEAISSTYGTAEKPGTAGKIVQGHYGDQEEVIARWQDPEYCFELIRSSYGPSFRLSGFQKRLKESADAATIEATRIEALEAPQRDAARIAGEKETERAKLENARGQNKPRFRP